MTGISRSMPMRVVSALVALLVGAGVYLLDRQADGVYFVAHWMVWSGETSLYFGALGNHLPTSIHVFAFILLTAVIVAPSRRLAIGICIFWLVIDGLFEVGQIPVIAQAIARHIPEWFGEIPFLENTSAYFLTGTFDVLDLYSIVVGTLAAFVTLVLTAREEENDDPDIQIQ